MESNNPNPTTNSGELEGQLLLTRIQNSIGKNKILLDIFVELHPHVWFRNGPSSLKD